MAEPEKPQNQSGPRQAVYQLTGDGEAFWDYQDRAVSVSGGEALRAFEASGEGDDEVIVTGTDKKKYQVSREDLRKIAAQVRYDERKLDPSETQTTLAFGKEAVALTEARRAIDASVREDGWFSDKAEIMDVAGRQRTVERELLKDVVRDADMKLDKLKPGEAVYELTGDGESWYNPGDWADRTVKITGAEAARVFAATNETDGEVMITGTNGKKYQVEREDLRRIIADVHYDERRKDPYEQYSILNIHMSGLITDTTCQVKLSEARRALDAFPQDSDEVEITDLSGKKRDIDRGLLQRYVHEQGLANEGKKHQAVEQAAQQKIADEKAAKDAAARLAADEKLAKEEERQLAVARKQAEKAEKAATKVGGAEAGKTAGTFNKKAQPLENLEELWMNADFSGKTPAGPKTP